MKIQKIFVLISLAFIAQGVLADRFYADDVSVEIIKSNGRELPTFPADNRRKGNIVKSFVQAKQGQPYAIRVTNHSNERIGFVIAVDGRNIISGKHSRLKSKERKYVLGPFEQAVYRGWRSSRNHVNEFYFTDEDNSYSAAFGDYSAMGVIAVAVFRDRDRNRYNDHAYDRDDGYRQRESNRSKSSAPSADSAGRSGKFSSKAESQPGTGYGDERYSHSRRVRFNEEKRAAVKFLFKYEWRETLCRKGVVDCRNRGNRLWKEDNWFGNRGFAPPPPRYQSSKSRYRF